MSIDRALFDKYMNTPSNATARTSEYYKHQTEVWGKEDTALIQACDKTLENFLLVTTLFSAVVAPFLLASIPMLQPDLQRATLNALLQISAQLPVNQTSAGISVTYPPEDAWLTSRWPLVINMLWSLALVIGLVTAVFAMLVKRWLLAFQQKRDNTLPDDVDGFREQSVGLRKWGVNLIVGLLPLCLHFAIAVFLIGLIPFTWHVSKALGVLVSTLVSVGVFLYGLAALLGHMVVSCPYTAPLPNVNVQLGNSLPAMFVYQQSRKLVAAVISTCWSLARRFTDYDVAQAAALLEELGALEDTMRRAASILGDDDASVIDRFIIDLNSEHWPLPDEVVLSLVGWRAPQGIGRAAASTLASQLSSRSLPSIKALLADVLRRGLFDKELHQNIGRLAAMASVTQNGFPLAEEHRRVLQSWVGMLSSYNDVRRNTSLLVCAFLLFANGFHREEVRNITSATTDDSTPTLWMAFRTLKRVLDHSFEARNRGSSLIATCLLFECFERFGVQARLPWDEFAPFIQKRGTLPREWLASFLAIVGQLTHSRGQLSVREPQAHLTYRFIWTRNPGEQLVGIFSREGRLRTAEGSNSLGTMAPNVFRSLLIYVARNHHTFSHVKENLITALEPLGSADALPLPCDSKGQPDYNANSPLSDLVQHVISSLKSNNHVTATPVPSPNQQPEPSLSVQPVAQSVELPNQPDSSANELPGLLRRLAAALERREQLEDNRKTGQSNNDQTNVLSSAAEDDSKQIEAVSDSVAQPANPPTSLSADSNAQPNGA